MDDSAPEDVLSWENLIYIADLAEASGEKNVALLGGEPFLHPHSVEFILYLLKRDLHVNVFTSGILSEKTLGEAARHLGGRDPERLSIVCNINDPGISTAAESGRIKRFLGSLGRLTSAGFNIYRPDFELDFLFQLINQFGLKRHVRLGLAHPIPGRDYNQHVKIEDMREMAGRLVALIPKFESFGIMPLLDCGMPLCLFSEEQLGRLYKLNGGRLNFGCSPAFDIGPDMSVWSCFATSNYQKKSLYEFDSIADIYEFFSEMHRSMRVEAGGIFEECDACKHRDNGLCAGGCLAHNLTHFMNEPKVRLASAYPDE